MALLAPFPNTLPQELRDEIFNIAAAECSEPTFMMVDVHSRQRAGYPNRYHTLIFNKKKTLDDFLQFPSITQTPNLRPKPRQVGLLVRRLWLETHHFPPNAVYDLLDVCANVRDISASWRDFENLFWPSSGEYPAALHEKGNLHLTIRGSQAYIPEKLPLSAIPILSRVTRFTTFSYLPQQLLTSNHPLFENVTHLSLILRCGYPNFDEPLPPLPALQMLVYFYLPDRNLNDFGTFGTGMVLKHLLQDRRVCVMRYERDIGKDVWKNRPDHIWERAPGATVAAGRKLLRELRFNKFDSCKE
ncbi:hypothetical protein C8J56DRAFT_329631 [Mycena floridula]|nr:hypothetical protein C8J56DRAFT_329631 [Mycena floridula]